MSRICLAFLSTLTKTTVENPLLVAYVEALEAQGHVVDVVEARDQPEKAGSTAWPWNQGGRGPAAGILAAWATGQGEILIAVDARMGYRPDDLLAAVRQVERDPEPIVLASRFGGYLRADSVSGLHRPGWSRRGTGVVLKWLSGSSDPGTGLICLSRTTFELAGLRFAPIGRRLAFEFLIKCPGATLDVGVDRGTLFRGRRPDFDDVRQIKRLVNVKLGNLSRLIQFCAVGASGMVVDLTVFAGLSAWLSASGWWPDRTLVVFGEPLATRWIVSAATAIFLALIWNFTLNRHLTFSDARQGSVIRQFLTYVVGNAAAVSLSFLIRLGLPLKVAFFANHRLAAAVVGVVVATGVSFSLSRWIVFRSRVRPNTAVPQKRNRSIGQILPDCEQIREEAPTILS